MIIILRRFVVRPTAQVVISKSITDLVQVRPRLIHTQILLWEYAGCNQTELVTLWKSLAAVRGYYVGSILLEREWFQKRGRSRWNSEARGKSNESRMNSIVHSMMQYITGVRGIDPFTCDALKKRSWSTRSHYCSKPMNGWYYEGGPTRAPAETTRVSVALFKAVSRASSVSFKWVAVRVWRAM